MSGKSAPPSTFNLLPTPMGCLSLHSIHKPWMMQYLGFKKTNVFCILDKEIIHANSMYSALIMNINILTLQLEFSCPVSLACI